MSVRKFMPENRLAKSLLDPSGLLFGQALNNAAMNVDKVRDTHLAALNTKLDSLAGLAASAAVENDPAEEAELYRLAREILTDSGSLGLADVHRAAHSLCELLASTPEQSQLRAGIAVHVHAISAVRKPGKGAAREAILAGLEQISRSQLRRA